MAQLSKKDQGLSPEAQAGILQAKADWQAAYERGDTNAMAEANNRANQIRSDEGGYTAGTTGAGRDVVYNDTPAGVGGGAGRTAEQMRADMAAYTAEYYTPGKGWTNGYSTEMNTRSKANEIRQQMAANEAAMAGATAERQAYLHQQNLDLAEVLYDYTGHTQKTTYYNEDAGRWETWNPDVGYGYNMNGTLPKIRDGWQRFYGYTDEEIENWAKDNSHYYNFVDVRAPARNTIDESSGFTGRYAQFKNGPYASLLSGSQIWRDNHQWEDVIGDGFGDEGTFVSTPQYDADGNIIKNAPALKNNNSASAYTRQFLPTADVTTDGVLTRRGTKVGGNDAAAGGNNTAGQMDYYMDYGRSANNRFSNSVGGSSGGGFTGYLQEIYASALEAQLKALESGYAANLSELDASEKTVDGVYAEQKRLTSGESARQSAAWREVANAYGLNSGAVGQANLAQRNQLQSDLNKLNAAQAAARAELQRQRLLLGQQYQLAIEQAVAENNSQLALNLYQEAVRAEESLRQEEQFYANLALQYGKSMMSFAKSTGSLSLEDQFSVIEDAVKNGYISDAQARLLAQQMRLI